MNCFCRKRKLIMRSGSMEKNWQIKKTKKIHYTRTATCPENLKLLSPFHRITTWTFLAMTWVSLRSLKTMNSEDIILPLEADYRPPTEIQPPIRGWLL